MIIFDLGGVLLQEAEINLAQVLAADLDIERIEGRPPRIFNRMFEFINLIYGKECKRDWIMGILSGEQIIQKINEEIDKPEHDLFFKNNQEKNLIKYGAGFILVPHKLVPLTQLSKEGLEFVQKCKQSGLRILILSNWDPHSFQLIKEKFPELFSLFDEQDIVIPAYIGSIKPEDAAFNYMVTHLNLDIANTFFVDDSATNVNAARKYGIVSVVHRDWQQTEQELMQKGMRF